MNRASNTGLMTIRLTRDNRFPAAGVEVQLTDGNKIYNPVTDQNGRASTPRRSSVRPHSRSRR